MNPGDVAPMIVMVTAILTAGGVLLFWPLSRRVGELLRVMAQERLAPGSDRDVLQLHDLLARLDSRLSLLEERQGFTESLMDAKSAAIGERIPLSRVTNGSVGSGARGA